MAAQTALESHLQGGAGAVETDETALFEALALNDQLLALLARDPVPAEVEAANAPPQEAHTPVSPSFDEQPAYALPPLPLPASTPQSHLLLLVSDPALALLLQASASGEGEGAGAGSHLPR